MAEACQFQAARDRSEYLAALHALDQAPGQHLADVQPSHDGFTCTSIICKQEARARLGQHGVINCDAHV
jgi:hypothetical protein